MSGRRANPAVTAWLLGVLSFGAFAYFYQAGSWNSNTRFDLVRAIVERQTLSIEPFHHNTGDKALRDGLHYCDKAPGVSFLCLPAYAVVDVFHGGHPEMDHVQTLGSYVCVLSGVSLPSAVAVSMLFLLLHGLELRRPWPVLLSLGYAFGTLVWPYSTLYYGHQSAAAFGLIGFSILMRSRLRGAAPAPIPAALAGASLGLAVMAEYTAGLAVASISLYAVFAIGRKRPLLWLAAGAAVPAAALLAYHWAAFGSPLALPYDFSTQRHRHTGLFMGIGVPTTRALYYLTVDQYRGLFYSAPWLWLAVPGLACLVAARHTRAAGSLATFLAVAHLLIAAGLTDWHGGWSMGPRHLISTLPWLTLGVAGLAAAVGGRAGTPSSRSRAIGNGVVLVGASLAIAYACFLMLVGTSVKPEVPRAVEQPFTEFLLPRFAAGELAINTQSIDFVTGPDKTVRYAWNLGERMGLEGRFSLAPLGLWFLGIGGLIAFREARSGGESPVQ